MLDKGFRLWPLDGDFSHVTDVKDPAFFTHSFVLGENARVADGHQPATEFDHLGPASLMLAVKGRLH